MKTKIRLRVFDKTTEKYGQFGFEKSKDWMGLRIVLILFVMAFVFERY